MQKTFAGIVLSVLIVGLIVAIHPVRAENAPAPTTTVGATEAALLRQTLNVLGQVLDQIQTQLADPNTVVAQNPQVVSATLGALGANLSLIGSTLRGESVAVAESTAPTPTAPVVKAPEAMAPPAKEAPAAVSPIIQNPQPIMKEPSNEPSDKVANETSPLVEAPIGLVDENASAEASTKSVLSGKAPIGIGIAAALLVGFGLYLWLRKGDEEEPQVKPAKQKAMMVSDKRPQETFDRKIFDSAIDSM